MKKWLYFACAIISLISHNSLAQGWRKAYLPEVDPTAYFIQFADSLNGCVFAESKFFRTTDGGNAWVRCDYPAGYSMMNARMATPNDIVLILYDPKVSTGIRPRIFTTTDAGVTWRMDFSFTRTDGVLASYILSNTKVWILGENYKDAKNYCWNANLRRGIYDSTLIPTGYPFPVGNWWYKGIGFRDSLNGYITAGQGLAPGLLPWGLVLKTTDGGKSWQDDTVMYAASFERVEFSDPMHGYVSGRIKYDYDPTRQFWTSWQAIRYTTDGGNSWTFQWMTGVVKGYFIDDSLFCWINQNGDPPKSNGYFLQTNLLYDKLPYPFIIHDPDLYDFCKIGNDRTWVLRDDGRTIYIWDPLLTAVREGTSGAMKCVLYQNYPNPAYEETRIRFLLRNPAAVSLDLYDLLGRVVRHFAEGNYGAGNHEVRFNIEDLPAGIYLYTLEISEQNQPTQRLARIMTHARMK